MTTTNFIAKQTLIEASWLNDVNGTTYVATPAGPLATTVHAATLKVTPVDNDELPLADSASSFSLKKLTWANLKSVLQFSSPSASKATPVDADALGLYDSAATTTATKLTWANLKATLQTTLPFLQSGTGAVATTVQAKLRQTISVKDFGATGDGVTDDTAAIQAAITATINTGKSLFIPGTTARYLITATLNIAGTLRIYGDGAFIANDGGTMTGSILYFNHLGKGFNVNQGTLTWGVVFENIATLRNQATPVSGWVPIAADYDFYFNNVQDAVFRDVFIINPTKGIWYGGPNPGRLNVDGLYGQPLSIGVLIDTAYDTATLHNIHFWPYWMNSAYIHSYTMANLQAIHFLRCDNPFLDTFFCIFAQFGVYCTLGANGVLSKLHMSNCDIDIFGSNAIVIAAGESGVTVQLENISAYGSPGSTASSGIAVLGTNATIVGSNIRLSNLYVQGIFFQGAGNFGKFSNVEINDWNISNTAATAVYAGSGSTLEFANPILTSGGNGAPIVNDAITISSPVYVNTFTPVVTATSGTFTTVSAVMSYMHFNKEVSFTGTITITTNGTAAGGIYVTLPLNTGSGGIFFASGRETSLTGKMLDLQFNASSNAALIYFYDNTYPGADGSILHFSGKYAV